jgi:NAD(P)-dependent dehydrogenase (short-subunit alcohol dehydrogenase family)
VHGPFGLPGNAIYVGSKHGVVGLTRTAALEMAPHGVRVNCLCPGATRTELFERSSGGGVGGEEAVAAIVPMARALVTRRSLRPQHCGCFPMRRATSPAIPLWWTADSVSSETE